MNAEGWWRDLLSHLLGQVVRFGKKWLDQSGTIAFRPTSTKGAPSYLAPIQAALRGYNGTGLGTETRPLATGSLSVDESYLLRAFM